MPTSTSEDASQAASTPFRWPLGRGMVPILVLTTIGAAGLLGTVAGSMLHVGSWSYLAWAGAAALTLATMRSAETFTRGDRSAAKVDPRSGFVERLPIDSLSPHDPPMVETFRRRMGGWGTYVAGAVQFHGMIAASGVVALVVSGTLLQADESTVRAGAVLYLCLIVLARAWAPRPRWWLTILVLVVVVLGLLGLGLHLEFARDEIVDEAARPRAPRTFGTFLEASALLPIAFLPLMRTSLMLPGLPERRRRWVRRWVLPLSAVAAAGLGSFLDGSIEGVLKPASPMGTALAEAVSKCPSWFGLAVQVVTLVLGTHTILVLLDDTHVIGGRLARLNSVPDVFTAAPGRRIAVPGELYVLGLATMAVALAPTTLDLLAFSAFCVLVLFGAIHVAVMRPRSDGGHRIAVLPMVALMASVALVFSLPAVVILAGVAFVSATILTRAMLIVWSAPLSPDVDEDLGRRGSGERDGSGPRAESARGARSATATRRAEDAPGDLPADDGAGGPEHRPEG